MNYDQVTGLILGLLFFVGILVSVGIVALCSRPYDQQKIMRHQKARQCWARMMEKSNVR